MRMGIVGPVQLVDKAHKAIKEKYPELELTDIIYKEYDEIAALVEAKQPDQDALLFVGKIPFKISEEEVKCTVPWEYAPRHGSTLLRTLLEASVIRKYDITSISFDTYDKELLYQVYEEIGFKKELLKIYVADQKLLSKNYMDYLYRFHSYNYYTNRVSCVITGVSDLYKKLQINNIPSILMVPVESVILATAEKLRLRHLAQSSRDNQIVVMTIQIDFPSERSIVKNDEYENIISKMKISECIYLFASKIKAAVVEVNYQEYMIFTTKKILETETNGYEDIYLFELIEEKTFRTVSLGIGYGETVQDAKFNAYAGLNRALAVGGNTGFAVYDNGEFKGPLMNKTENSQKIVGNRLSNISEKTGISINNLYKIFNAAEKCSNHTFSSKELSLRCEINQRSMDRILQKLEDEDFCEIVGKRMTGATGRASRIMRLTFF